MDIAKSSSIKGNAFENQLDYLRRETDEMIESMEKLTGQIRYIISEITELTCDHEWEDESHCRKCGIGWSIYHIMQGKYDPDYAIQADLEEQEKQEQLDKEQELTQRGIIKLDDEIYYFPTTGNASDYCPVCERRQIWKLDAESLYLAFVTCNECDYKRVTLRKYLPSFYFRHRGLIQDLGGEHRVVSEKGEYFA